jgi:hypothetical protein
MGNDNKWRWYIHKRTKVRARKCTDGRVKNTPFGKVWPGAEFWELERNGKEWANTSEEFEENYEPYDDEDDYG